ncbi:MAG: glycoside hydrolase family 3 C-terminal domain-containing protein [Ignavibacteriales bacterium]|nr:glycoside hydrolase family 3 C-terminal domain-containing protein [Ignavibacteriales bacterium]
MKTKTIFHLFILLSSIFTITIQSQTKSYEKQIDSVLSLMTLEEKTGQLHQVSLYWATGPESPEGDKLRDIKEGRMGSVLNVKGSDKVRALQELALKSRLGIPLLFGLDVIHGYKTTFPIPLAESASWDIEAIELAARIAAIEASASGLNWTFAPMVDIARDARWGRIMEGAGEDTYLGSLIAAARVKGFQGKGFGSVDAVMACVKHYAAYGAAVGGRDYNSVDMSERTLREIYLPPFKAAAMAGAATFMNSFNDLNGVPASGSSFLMRKILKGEWNFNGFIVSDWASIREMIPHGFAEDDREAAKLALNAGSDMDMEGYCYRNNLKDLVEKGEVSLANLDDAVRRILRKKFEMGLFEDPFRFTDPIREEKALNNPEHRKAARDMARKSIVLIKNEADLLPLKKGQKIALIGPLAKSEDDMLGGWAVGWDDNSDVVSQFEGLEIRFGKENLLYAKGCGVSDSSKDGFEEAVKIANEAEVVILSIGESRSMNGEAASRSNLGIPGVQEDLVKAIMATGKPVVVLMNAGRPLVFNWVADNVPTILYTWWLGSEAGNAIADVISGDYNPSGKLTVSFPRNEGQIPIYYNHFNTGRPSLKDIPSKDFRTGYIDLKQSPKFPFGFGLSYTTFDYSDINISSDKLSKGGVVEVSLTVKNTGDFDGEEVVQLYIRDCVASLVRPMKELKDFKKIALKSGESKKVTFKIDEQKLAFYNEKLEWVTEPGKFDIMIGSSSADIRQQSVLYFE